MGDVQLACYYSYQNAQSCYIHCPPAPLVRLEQQNDRRLPQIKVVVVLALHQSRQPCVTREAIRREHE